MERWGGRHGGRDMRAPAILVPGGGRVRYVLCTEGRRSPTGVAATVACLVARVLPAPHVRLSVDWGTIPQRAVITLIMMQQTTVARAAELGELQLRT